MIALSAVMLTIMPQQILAQDNFEDMPRPSADEVQMGIAVGLRLATIEACGHDRSHLPIYQRYNQFLEGHQDGYENRDITNRIERAVAMEASGKQKSMQAMCPQIGAMPEDQLQRSLDGMDRPLIEAHYRAGHIERGSSEYARMEQEFGPIVHHVSPVRSEPDPPSEDDRPYGELTDAIDVAAGELRTVGDIKTLVEAASGRQMLTGEAVSGINPETGERVTGRCAYVNHEIAKTVLLESMGNGSPMGGKKNPAEVIISGATRSATVVIGGIACLVGN